MGDTKEVGIPKSLLISSALAGSLARIPTHPLDTMKARMMATSSDLAGSSVSLARMIRHTITLEGFRGLYRGFWFTAISSLPASCLYFTSQEWSRQHLFSNSLLSGFFAEAVACIIYVPIDVVKERLQVQRMDIATRMYGPTYSTGIKAVQSIIGTEGVRGLYKGYLSTLGSFGPFSALYFFFYEGYRKQMLIFYDNPPAYAFWLGGGLCGAMAAFLTTPLDLVKLRKQLDPRSSAYYSGGMIPGLIKTFREEGIKGNFRGASARVLFLSPTSAFSMALFEVLKINLEGI